LRFKKFDSNIISKYRKKYNLKKYFSISNDKLLKLKLIGEKKSGVELADLRTYFRVTLTKEEFNEFKKDKNILLIYKEIKNIPRPQAIDIQPVTPNWENEQGYIESFENYGGINSRYAWQFQGGRGKNVTVVDIEGGWDNLHEDLGLTDPYIYDENGNNLTGTPIEGENHINSQGTAVLGEIYAQKNDYGITGIAHKSTIKVINDYCKEYGYSTADAIIRGISVLPIGSIILLESQKGGPNYQFDPDNPDSQYGLVPDEWLQAEFDAIKTATANGFVIVEAGANGEQNLDDEVYSTCKGDINTYFTDNSGNEPCFDTNTRDSGAIIVAAGNPPNGNWGVFRSKMYYTSYGKRIDVQAWGMDIYSIGYGDLFFPDNDVLQAYTSQFGGTSGASPIITGISALVQSRYMEKNNNDTLTSQQIREILKNPLYSHKQKGDEINEHIGPLPDLKLIFKLYFNDNYTCQPHCEDWEYCKQDEAVCKNLQGRCSFDSDCTEDKICDTKTHNCVIPCEIIACEEWQTCNNDTRSCLLKENRCNNDNDCSDFENCNPVVHKCIDPCNNLQCQENSTCKRFDDNTIAECICNKGYFLNNDNICEKAPEQNLKKGSESCNFGNKNFINLILMLIFLLINLKFFRE